MLLSEAVQTDSWMNAEGRSLVGCEVMGEQVQFEFGNNNGSLHLVLDEFALGALITVATEAYAKWQAIEPGAVASFVVTPAES
jgi:hypothetical protein